MNRRRFLQSAVGGGVVFTTGCVLSSEDTEPLNFGIDNWRTERYSADVSLEKNGEQVLFDADIDVPAHQGEESDPVGVFMRDVARVSNGDTIHAVVLIDNNELETQYEISCSEDDRFDNNLFLRIFSNVERGMQFRQNEC